jgi:hypothetical protein
MENLNSANGASGVVEAVIISGPRKGEFITLPESEEVMTPEIDLALQLCVKQAQHLAESARAAHAEAKSLLSVLRAARGV